MDNQGNNIHEEFPLKYGEELFESILNELAAMPIPQDDELDEWHGIGTKNNKRTQNAS